MTRLVYSPLFEAEVLEGKFCTVDKEKKKERDIASIFFFRVIKQNKGLAKYHRPLIASTVHK